MTNGRATCTAARWLSIVGIGEDGVDGLSPVAQQADRRGRAGGRRQAPSRPGRRADPRPQARLAEPDRRGDAGDREASRPAGRGAGERRSVPLRRRRHAAALDSAAETLCLPQPSAFSLAAARLGWSLQDVALVSLHGRALEGIVRHLQPGARILALSWDGETPAKLAKLLAERGIGGSSITVLEAMGGPRERVRRADGEGLRSRRRSRRSTPSPSRSTRVAGRDRARRSRPASTMACSSMTASSPSARCAPSRCRRWRRGRASSCGTSAWARARSPSNGCCAIRR